MRISREVREELEDIKKNYPTPAGEIAGWVEALEWVLSDYVEEESK